MSKLGFLLVFISIGLINCEHFDVKGGHLKGPSFWSSYKAKVIELPSPTIEHIAPIQQRLIVEEKTHHEPIQERLVVREKIHTVQPKIVEEVKVVEHHPQVIEQVKVVEHHPKVIEQIRVEEAVKGVRQHHHHENLVLHDERRHEELHQQREQREQLKEIQHFQQIQQHEQIRQQLEQQRNLEHVVQKKLIDVPAPVVEHVVQKKVVEVSAPIIEGKTVQHIEQIVQQKQQRNEKLTDEEEAVAEPFPLIPKTSFTCDDKPVLPGMYADVQTGCRVYHFCFAKQKADIVEQVHQDKLHQIDALHADVHHQNSLLVHHLPQPEQQQMKSFFCGQGTLFNQKLLICDHEVNVICPESIHFYSANLEFGKPSAEPAAKLVQQREITKTNYVQIREPEPIVQVREQIVQQPIVQVKEQVILQPEPVKTVQHHDAIKIVEPPRPIVQVREQIVQHPEPVVQVREQIVQHPVKTVVHESAPVKGLPPLSPVKIGHLIEQPVIVEQRKDLHTTTNKIVHEDRVVTSTHTDTDAGSFASSSELHPNWRENNSWKTSRIIWGNNETTTNSNEGENRLKEDAQWAPAINRNNNDNSNDRLKKLEEKPKILGRRFLGELMTNNIPNTSFSCEGKPFDGFYADHFHNCTIYHQCFNGKRSTYKCSKGTLFDQATLSCNFEDKVKCSESEKFYTTNTEFN